MFFQVTELCQDVPHIIEGPETLEQCKVNVGEAKCSEIELVLPKQVCKDLVFGYADVSYGHEQHHGGYEVPPPPPYHDEPSYSHEEDYHDDGGYHEPEPYHETIYHEPVYHEPAYHEPELYHHSSRSSSNEHSSRSSSSEESSSRSSEESTKKIKRKISKGTKRRKF